MDSSESNAILINDDSYIPGSDSKSKNNEKALWSSINFTLALAALIIALSGIILGLVTYIQLHDHFVRTKETVICNTGNNDGLDLPLCGQEGIAPGLPILFGKDEKILGRRFTKGLGVQLESFDDSHIQVGVLVESLSPLLSVGKKITSQGESITFNITEREETPLVCNAGDNTGLDLPDCPQVGVTNGTSIVFGDTLDPTVTYVKRFVSEDEALIISDNSDFITFNVNESFIIDPCDITCPENFKLTIENSLDGFGIVAGFNHTFPDDGTVGGSAILSGIQNAVTNANASTIVGGRENEISDTFCSLIGTGRNHVITSEKSAIVSGEGNLISASHAFCGSGERNTISAASGFVGSGIDHLVSGTRSGIVSGDNSIISGDDSFVGSGDENVISGDQSGIVSGSTNDIGGNFCIVGSGSENSILAGVVSSSIVSGQQNVIDGSSFSLIGSGDSNTLTNSDRSSIISGTGNTITGGSDNLIGSGINNEITGGPSSIIAAGDGNFIDGIRAGIFVGINNYLEGTECFIGAGSQNNITGGIQSAIVAGSGNTIIRFSGFNGLLIGAGNDNYVEAYSGEIGIFVGKENTMIGGNNAMIGCGQNNILIEGYDTYIGSGSRNNITDSIFSMIGSGRNNLQTLTNSSAIVSGVNNTIDAGGVFTRATSNIIGAGESNFMVSRSSAIVSGDNNYLAGRQLLIGAGDGNILNGLRSVILSGENNQIVATGPTPEPLQNMIGIGINNIIEGGERNTIISGIGNVIQEGEENYISGGNFNTLLDDSGSLLGTSSGTITSGDRSALISCQSVEIDAGGFSERVVGIGLSLTTLTEDRTTTVESLRVQSAYRSNVLDADSTVTVESDLETYLIVVTTSTTDFVDLNSGSIAADGQHIIIKTTLGTPSFTIRVQGTADLCELGAASCVANGSIVVDGADSNDAYMFIYQESPASGGDPRWLQIT